MSLFTRREPTVDLVTRSSVIMDPWNSYFEKERTPSALWLKGEPQDP